MLSTIFMAIPLRGSLTFIAVKVLITLFSAGFLSLFFGHCSPENCQFPSVIIMTTRKGRTKTSETNVINCYSVKDLTRNHQQKDFCKKKQSQFVSLSLSCWFSSFLPKGNSIIQTANNLFSKCAAIAVCCDVFNNRRKEKQLKITINGNQGETLSTRRIEKFVKIE